MGNENNGPRGYTPKRLPVFGMGKRIDDLLFEKNMSVVDLADAIGYHRITIRYLMQNNDGKISTISEIAKFFGVSLDWLINGTGNRK